MIGSARLRVGQFLSAMAARRDPPDPALGAEILPAPLLRLFAEMSPADRRHGLDVLGRLRRAGHADAILLQAALLHDVGKANAGVTVGHRIARVLVSGNVEPVWRWLTRRATGWRRPFWVLAHHPERGAIWVQSVGGAPELAGLIRYHEAPAPDEWVGTPQGERHAALSAVDAQC